MHVPLTTTVLKSRSLLDYTRSNCTAMVTLCRPSLCSYQNQGDGACFVQCHAQSKQHRSASCLIQIFLSEMPDCISVVITAIL